MNKPIELKNQPASEFDRKGYNTAYYLKRKEDEALYYAKFQAKKADLVVGFLGDDNEANKMDLLLVIDKICETHVDKVIEILQKIGYHDIDELTASIKKAREDIRKDIFKTDKPSIINENSELRKEEL